MSPMLRRDRFPVVDFGHPPHSSAAEARVLVTVSPAIHRALDEAALASEAGVELSQSPAHRVALGFVVQSVAFVLVLGAARPRVNAILRLELLRETVHVHRFHVAPDGVLHLDSVSRVLESDPLHAVLVLPNNEGSRGGNGARRGVRVDGRSGRRALMKTRRARHARHARRRGRRGTHSGALPLKLTRRHLRPRTACERGGYRVGRVLRERLSGLLRHEAGVDGSRLRRGGVLSVRRLLRHRVRRIPVHRL